MATALASQKWLANNLTTVYDFDPGVTTAVDVGWVDMRDYSTLTVIAIRTIGTGTTDAFTILSNPESDGSGTDVEIKTHALASEPDAISDFVVLECDHSELGGNRYVSASLTMGTGTDEMMVVYIRSGGLSQLNLTADTIA